MKTVAAAFGLGLAILVAPFAMTAPAVALSTFPACESAWVHSLIKSRFNHAETRRLHDGAAILSIAGVHERAVELFGPSPVPRRYCRAQALMEHDHDGGYHYLYFRISERAGLAGMGWNVEFCIPGHDEWKVFDGDCRVLRR